MATWQSMSGCHYRPCGLPPTAEELIRWLDVVDAVIARAEAAAGPATMSACRAGLPLRVRSRAIRAAACRSPFAGQGKRMPPYRSDPLDRNRHYCREGGA